MPTTEPTINDTLAEALKETRSLWRETGVVKSENTGVLKAAGKKPDILIRERDVSPVVVETEVLPASSVDADARQRLGEHLTVSNQRILSSLAVRLPDRLIKLDGQALKKEIIKAADFEMALYTGESLESFERWPRSGWLRGNITDLSILIQSASVPPAVIEEAADKLEDGVKAAASLIADMTASHPGAMRKICDELRQPEGEQTRRMAMTILANALVFHESLSRGVKDLYNVRTLAEHKSNKSGVSQNEVLKDWGIILGVNYWPIFDIARRILEVIPADTAKPLLESLVTTAGELVANHMMKSHDLTGAVFQRLIADRKFLAAFYTHPASAALLVGLAIEPDKTPANGSWAKDTDVTALRIADLSCGTGTLLSAAYRRVSQLHEAAGGDSEMIHAAMMEKALVGCDVLPVAAHLTASMLAATHPKVSIEGSSIMTMGLGPREGGGFSLGSLDLLAEQLDKQRAFDMIAITAKAIEGKGEQEKDTWSALRHASFDLIVMNPPFTRDTGQEAKKIGVPNPMFAAFGFTAEQQRTMAHQAEKLLKGTSAHGNAGEGSSFLALADRKLKNGGTLAMVLELTLMTGEAWEKSRKLLRNSYRDIILVSIAAKKDDDLSFSKDTGMAECLMVGRKTIDNEKRATFVVLNERPSSDMTGATVAAQIHQLKHANMRNLEDGPLGGSPFHFGDDVIGWAIDAPLPDEGTWNLVRIKDGALAQTAYQLANRSLVWLPSMPKDKAVHVSISIVSRIGQIGPYHMDINADTPIGGIRGPFQKVSLNPDVAPTYPILWSHDAKREKCIEFEADSEGIVRKGKDDAEDADVTNKANRIWLTASHCHFNRDFRFNSQPTAMQFTNRLTIGGRAWPAIKLETVEQEKALVLWANSSLGILLHWWQANKQQAGRGSIGVSALASLPVLDVTKLSKETLAKAVVIFNDMKHMELRPVNEIAQDPVRAEIDTKLVTEVLGLPPELAAPDGPLALLRQKLALEPSIAGSKHVADA